MRPAGRNGTVWCRVRPGDADSRLRPGGSHRGITVWITVRITVRGGVSRPRQGCAGAPQWAQAFARQEQESIRHGCLQIGGGSWPAAGPWSAPGGWLKPAGFESSSPAIRCGGVCALLRLARDGEGATVGVQGRSSREVETDGTPVGTQGSRSDSRMKNIWNTEVFHVSANQS